ncbi:MAG: MMPL family transporter, partial [Firmicutes bacterium]|nr:MMPL family transporter [Bacillota bacterium]
KFCNPGYEALPSGSHTRTTYNILLSHTFNGVLGPVFVLVQSPHTLWTSTAWNNLQKMHARLDSVANVHQVEPTVPALPAAAFQAAPPALYRHTLSRNRHDFLFLVYPDTHPESQATQHLIEHLRSLSYPSMQSQHSRVLVGGNEAYTVDVIHLIIHWLPYIAGMVALTTMLVLYRLFRSWILPFKAVVMNFLSAAAAFGLLVLIFQQGVTAPWTGIHGSGAIDWTTPIILFTVLFSLSTDYEVFLLSRVMDHHQSGASDAQSVENGMAETGRIITGAALIMVLVFFAFGSIGLEFMKELGYGLGLAILLDATVVRMILVPAIMRLLGRWNWWPAR